MHLTFLNVLLVPGLGEVVLPSIAGPTLFAVLRKLETAHGGGRTGGFWSQVKVDKTSTICN